MPQHANCKGLIPVSLCNCHLLQQALGPCDSDFGFTWGRGFYIFNLLPRGRFFTEIESFYLEVGDKTWTGISESRAGCIPDIVQFCVTSNICGLNN